MANKHLVVGIDWYGPFTLEAAKSAARVYHAGGLYICVGKTAGKHKRLIQYVGKSNDALQTRLNYGHHKLKLVTREMEIWLGDIATGNVPGKSKTVTPQSLRMAEWAIAYFMKLPLNAKLLKSPPKRAVTVLNRWWQKDYSPRFNRPHKDWPDLIDFLGNDYRERNVWFGSRGKMKTLSPADLGA